MWKREERVTVNHKGGSVSVDVPGFASVSTVLDSAGDVVPVGKVKAMVDAAVQKERERVRRERDECLARVAKEFDRYQLLRSPEEPPDFGTVFLDHPEFSDWGQVLVRLATALHHTRRCMAGASVEKRSFQSPRYTFAAATAHDPLGATEVPARPASSGGVDAVVEAFKAVDQGYSQERGEDLVAAAKALPDSPEARVIRQLCSTLHTTLYRLGTTEGISEARRAMSEHLGEKLRESVAREKSQDLGRENAKLREELAKLQKFREAAREFLGLDEGDRYEGWA